MHESELIILVPWISLWETAMLLHIRRVLLLGHCPIPGFILLSDLPTSPLTPFTAGTYGPGLCPSMPLFYPGVSSV